MGRAAGYRAGGDGERRRGGRPFKEPSFRRPAGADADGAPTVRNILPFRQLEKELAKKLAAKAGGNAGEVHRAGPDAPLFQGPIVRSPGGRGAAVAADARRRSPPHGMAAYREHDEPMPAEEGIERAPDSGVRASTTGLSNDSDSPLTYAVYNLADLEARADARMSMAFIPPAPPMPSRWGDVGRSGLVLLRVWWRHVRSPRPRPRLMDICRVPLIAFGADLRCALGLLPWKKIGTYVGIATGVLVAMLLVVTTLADLTDDVTPGHKGGLVSSTAGLAPDAVGATASAAGDAPVIEIDDDVPVRGARAEAPSSRTPREPAKPQPTPAKPKTPPKKPRPPDVFNP